MNFLVSFYCAVLIYSYRNFPWKKYCANRFVVVVKIWFKISLLWPATCWMIFVSSIQFCMSNYSNKNKSVNAKQHNHRKIDITIVSNYHTYGFASFSLYWRLDFNDFNMISCFFSSSFMSFFCTFGFHARGMRGKMLKFSCNGIEHRSVPASIHLHFDLNWDNHISNQF